MLVGRPEFVNIWVKFWVFETGVTLNKYSK